MKIKYTYSSPSSCIPQQNGTSLAFSTDLSREEKVSFSGKLKHPLLYRDAMLMLREIVVSDTRKKEKDRSDFFKWLNEEIDRRAADCTEEIGAYKKDLQKKIEDVQKKIKEKNAETEIKYKEKNKIASELNKYDIWADYNKIERNFWEFIKNRDYNLWWVLDPVITVHKDGVSFEAFSLDESTYGCLFAEMEEFEMLKEPELGTTNIDFSLKLAREIQRFRSYNEVKLSVNPEGFTVDSNILPEYVEKKIDLPDTWIKGFNQVSSAAVLGGININLTKTDMYDICSYMRKHKAKESPRHMKWILEPGKNVKILFEPFKDVLTLNAVYTGKQYREEKIWGRRRWLTAEKILPLADSFTVKLLGFGMPQFITAHMGKMHMTIGLTSWSSNDWVKGTAFNIIAGFVGEGCYEKVYNLLKEKRALSLEEIYAELNEESKESCLAAIGVFLKKGEGYYDSLTEKLRYRKLLNEELPEYMYKTTDFEKRVINCTKKGIKNLEIKVGENEEYEFTAEINLQKKKTSVIIDKDGIISKVNCPCSAFRRGAKNISEPCEHILALYTKGIKFTKLKLAKNRIYTMDNIIEELIK